MSWRQIALTPGTSAAGRVVAAQRWWGANHDPLRGPARGTVHTVLALRRQLCAHASPTDAATLSDYEPGDWSDLFAAAVCPSASIAAACNTFAISDSAVFADAPTHQAGGARLPPLLHVVAREEHDFEFNNHVYAAIRHSTSGPELAPCLAAACDPSERAVGPTLAETVAAVQNGHAGCAMLRGCDGATRALDEHNADDAADATTFHFYPHICDRRQIVYRNRSYFVITNLKPVEPAGHLLVVPRRVVGCLHDALSLADGGSTSPHLGEAVAAAIRALNRRRANSGGGCCDGFSVVVQQGRHAGQTVAHLHVHVIALTRGAGLAAPGAGREVDPDVPDTKRSAAELEDEERRVRVPRTEQAMFDEARQLADLVQ